MSSPPCWDQAADGKIIQITEMMSDFKNLWMDGKNFLQALRI